MRSTSLNCLMSWLTSEVVVPVPLAMRLRREPSMRSGSRRSARVIDRMMASMRAISLVVDLDVADLLGHAGQHRHEDLAQRAPSS